MGPSTDSQKALGRFNRSRHGLEQSKDSQEAVGRFDRSKHGLEPSIDCVGPNLTSGNAFGALPDSQEGLEHF